MVALINNNCQLCSLILKLLNFHNGKLSTVVREGFCYPDLLSLHVAEVRCSALIRRRKKAEEQRPKICRKRTNVRKLWPKRKFTHFCLARKFCSIIFHCYSANLLQILIAQNGTSRILSSLLKEAEPGSRDACESDRRIIPLMEERSSAALHFPDLNSILEFGESFENSHVLPEYFTYPFTLLTARCRRSETSLSYHSKWLLSQSLTVEAALSLPQLLPSSAVTVDVSYASPTQCSNRRVSVHCTANFIVHCLRKHSQFTISADSSSNLKSSSLWQYDCEYFNSLKLLFLLIILLVKGSNALLFSGAPGSYARYPKWIHTFENQLSLDFRTKQSNALLLYTDDGGLQGNFYCVTIANKKLQLDFRLGDETNYLSSKRPVITMRLNNIEVSDYRWHRLTLFQAWENVKLELDDTVLFKILNQHSFAFGNPKTNSDVFIGGVPQDTYLLGTMSSPLKRHTISFAGGVKNVFYRFHPQGVTSPQPIESVGLRESDDDYCKSTSSADQSDYFCRNGGICYSTNDGPMCDCSFTDFRGNHCEQVRFDSDLSFSGDELIGYDVSNNSAGMIRFRSENITLSFKTTYGRGLLYVGGDRLNYIYITLDNGAVIATSKFDRTEKRLIRMFSNYSSGRYDDDRWHTVTVSRTLTLMSLSVDDVKDEIRQYAPEIDWLVNSFAYLGGAPNKKNIPKIKVENFQGCMKKVKYEADAHLINFITLADQGYGQSIIRSTGGLRFSCSKPAIHATDVFSFNTGQHFITLPKWNSVASGSLSFQLRTRELDGLILYHGSSPTAKTGYDYFAFELIDGHLFMIINLGSGHVRLQTTAEKITDGALWHNVTLERIGRTGTVIVDNIRTDFSTPGVSANLIIEEPIYFGAVPWPVNESDTVDFHVPYPIWSANLRKGYIGCLRGVRINGISPNIASIFEEQQVDIKDGISYGCSANMNQDFCALSPCKNRGRCENGYNSFRCDCSVSLMEGPLCDEEPEMIDFSTKDVPPLLLPKFIESEAETIECKFRSSSEGSVLLDTKSVKSPSHRILLLLIKGELELHLNFNDSHYTFNWGSKLNDNRIHSMCIKRRGEKLLLFLDGKWEHSYFLSSPTTVLNIDEVGAGQSLHTLSSSHFTTRANSTLEEKFRGQMIKMLFNDYDVLKNVKRRSPANSRLSVKTNELRERYKVRNRKAKYSSVTFEKHNAYAMINDERLANIKNIYRISFKFRTLASSSVLLAFPTNSTYDTLALELYNGRIRYTYSFNSRIKSILSSALPDGQLLNDFKWHSIHVHQKSLGGAHHLVVDNRSLVMESAKGHVVNLDRKLYIGHIPPEVSGLLRLRDVPGFRGCISSLRIGNEYLDIMKDAARSSGITKGCHGPHTRCSPKTCLNRGKCIQKWNSIKCDCALTTYGGERCDSLGTTYVFDSSLSAIYYEYPQSTRPSTNRDQMAIGFRTRQATGVLLSVDCSVDGDFFTVFLKNAHLHIRYNLGSRDHDVGLLDASLNDDKHHSVIIYRQEANLTLYVDNREPIYYSPLGGDVGLVTLNMQWRVTVGASFNLLHRAKRRKREQIYDSYNGFITGVNFNGLMILDMLAQGSIHVHRIGSPRLVHMSSRSSSFMGKHSFMNNTPTNDDIFAVSEWRATSKEGLIEAEGSGCVEFEEQEKCQIVDFDRTGLITPILPTSRIVEEGVKSKTSSITSERTAPTATAATTKAVTQTSTAVAQVEKPDNLVHKKEGEYQATVNDLWSDIAGPPAVVIDSGQYESRNTTATATATITTIIPPPPPSSSPSTTATNIIHSNRPVKPLTFDTTIRTLQSTQQTIPSRTVTLSQSDKDSKRFTSTTSKVVSFLPTISTKSSLAEEGKDRMKGPEIKNWGNVDSQQRPQVFTVPTVSSSTLKHRIRTTLISHTIYAVRPTTPMGEVITDTAKAPTTPTDFPRTALISIASLSVIIIIAIVVFCVFRCRQSGPSTDQYPMVCSSKQSGYAPIPAELSPPMMRESSRQNSGPHFHNRINQLDGYQPIKGTVIPNGNNAVINVKGNNCASSTTNGRMKEFKEWYV